MKNIKDTTKIARVLSRSSSTMMEIPPQVSLPVHGPPGPHGEAKRIYKDYKIHELVRAYSVLKLSSYQSIVNNATSLIGVSKSVFGRTFTDFVIKKTMFQQFCGGENEDEVKIKSLDLMKRGIIPMLDYSVEADITSNAVSEEETRSTLDIKLDQLDLVGSCVESGVSPIKPSSLCNPNMLQDLTTFLRTNSFEFSTNSAEFEDFSEASFVKAVCSDISDTNLYNDMSEYAKNLYAIGMKAQVLNQQVLIDAEYFSFQPAIDYFALKAMQFFNRDRAVFLNTFQCYLKQTSDNLDAFISNSLLNNYHLGAKLVRGAYMKHEREVNAISPVHDTADDTHACYDQNSLKLVELIKNTEGKASVVFATHNLNSVKTIYQKINSLTHEEKSKIRFAQLNGMADDVTHFLVQKGEQPLKLLPYGPLQDVLPYLIRRAQENNSILSQTKIQRKEIAKELFHRFI